MYALRCFGGVSIEDAEGHPVRLRSQKHLGLLLYLAAHSGRAQARPQLARMFWDTPLSDARHSLSQALYDIRRHLPHLPLRATTEQVHLEEGAIDYEAALFENKVGGEEFGEAVQMYRGGFAPHLGNVGTGEFERWVESERRRTCTLAQLALRRQLERCDADGRWAEMCVLALRLIKLDFLDEAAHRALMRALWLHGDQPSALQHYERVEEELARELPEGLSRETRQLAESIRSCESPVMGSHPSEQPDTPFVGRELEFQKLREAVGRTDLSAPGFFAVVGEAGIGKSRLVKEVARTAEVEGATVVSSFCYPAETGVAYAPVLEGLEPLVRRANDEEESPEAGYAHLGHLFPSADRLLASDPPTEEDPVTGRLRLFEEVADVIRRRASHGRILWIVEDFHWVDTSSAKLIYFLARRLRQFPVSIVLTMRSNHDAAQELRARLDEGVTDNFPVLLELGPFSPDQVATIVTQSLTLKDPEQGIDLARALSGGNPYFAIEIARAASRAKDWIDQPGRLGKNLLGDEIRKLLTLRLRGLDQEAMRILEAVAILGRHAIPRLVAAASGLSLSHAAELGMELFERGLLRDDGKRVEFTHDIIRDFVYRDLGLLRRAALHLTVAELLTREHDVSHAVLAGHYHLAGDRERALVSAMEAAEESAAAYGHHEAIDMARLALEVAARTPDKLKALRLLAEAELALGLLEEATEHLQQILASSSELDREEKSALQLLVTRARVELSDWQGAATAIKEVDDGLTLVGDSSVRVERQMEKLFWKLKVQVRCSQADAAAETVAEIENLRAEATLTGELSSRANIGAICSVAAYTIFFESAAQGARLLSVLDLNELEEADVLRQRAHLLRGWAFYRLAEWDRASHELSLSLTVAQTTNDVVAIGWIYNDLACCAMEQGDWLGVRDCYRKAKELNESLSADMYLRLLPEVNLAKALFYQGQLKEAHQRYENALSTARRIGTDEIIPELHSGMALLGLQLGKPEEVNRHWRNVDRLVPESFLGSHERFWTEWLRAFLESRIRNDTTALDRLADLAEQHRAIDVASSMKMKWLSLLLSQKPIMSPQLSRSADFSELRRRMAERRLTWFVRFSQRWFRRAEVQVLQVGDCIRVN